MNKYGLFLKPGSNTFCFLKQQKENYKKINKRQNFVNDQPHLTLFHGKFNNNEEVLSNLIKLLLRFTNFRFYQRNRIFFNDYSEGFSTFVYKIDIDKNLLKLQRVIRNI